MRDSLESGGTCTLDVNGESVTFTDDEVSVSIESKPGYAASTGSRIAVVLHTELTPELESEGIGREMVHHIQGLRKKADLDYEARIIAFVSVDDDKITNAISENTDYIVKETLADELNTSELNESAMKISGDAKVNGVNVKFGIQLI
jgi:isoleucyl-tRNA synthetase